MKKWLEKTILIISFCFSAIVQEFLRVAKVVRVSSSSKLVRPRSTGNRSSAFFLYGNERRRSLVVRIPRVRSRLWGSSNLNWPKGGSRVAAKYFLQLNWHLVYQGKVWWWFRKKGSAQRAHALWSKLVPRNSWNFDTRAIRKAFRTFRQSFVVYVTLWIWGIRSDHFENGIMEHNVIFVHT